MGKAVAFIYLILSVAASATLIGYFVTWALL